MKVSIIIPVYNVENFIERCLNSVLNQTWSQLEVILVDDCSPDSSMDVAAEVLRIHPRGRIVTCLTLPKNQGISGARNSGVRQATGDYLYFLDSDDYLSPTCIELLVTKAEEHNVDWVIGGYEMTGGYRSAIPLSLETGLLPNRVDLLSTFLDGLWYVMPWNKLVRRSFFEKENLYFREDIVHEDELFSFQLACKAGSAYVVNEVTYYYVIHPTSFMGHTPRRNLDSRMKILKQMCTIIRHDSVLAENRYAYLLLEKLKYKFFDRILYFEPNDLPYQSLCYAKLRSYIYLPPGKAYRRFRPDGWLRWLTLHYFLSQRMGFLYYKGLVSLTYKLLLASDKLKRLSGR